MSIVRERLTPQASRSAALDAARRLLIERGPQAVTLKAVAAEIGKTHANLLHHFGSAAGLQAELARAIAETVTARIGEAVERARRGESDAREIVDGTFDAFGKEGAGALAAWMILSGNRDALDPIRPRIRALSINGLSRTLACPNHAPIGTRRLGDSLWAAQSPKHSASTVRRPALHRACAGGSRPTPHRDKGNQPVRLSRHCNS